MKTPLTALQSARSGFGYALITFTCFGITNFLLGAIAECAHAPDQAVLIAPVVLWLGTGLMGAVFLSSKRGKTLWHAAVSNPRHFWMAAGAGICLAMGMLTLKLGFTADPASKGPITAITAANAVLVALLARLILSERLRQRQWVGILVTVAGISIMAFSTGGGNALRGLGYGMITLLCFGITNTVLAVLGHRGMPSMSTALTIWLAVGVCGAMGTGISTVTGPNISNLKPLYLLPLALVAGLTLGAGMWSLKRGVTVGRAGPVTAIAGANAWLVTVLDLLAFRHFPSLLKLTGMAVALLGVAILALSASGRRLRG